MQTTAHQQTRTNALSPHRLILSSKCYVVLMAVYLARFLVLIWDNLSQISWPLIKKLPMMPFGHPLQSLHHLTVEVGQVLRRE